MDYGEPDSIEESQFPKILGRLEYLVANLPRELPEVALSDSAYRAFAGNFVLDQDILEKTGCEVATLGEQLEQVFGFKARTTGDGVVDVKERGPAVSGMIKVLRSFFDKHPSNNVLKKWIIDIAKGVEKAYLVCNAPVPEAAPGSSSKRPRSETLEALTAAPESSKEAKTKHVPSTGGPGRNPDALLHSLVDQFYTGIGKSRKSSYKCVGCELERQGNLNKPRILSHAASCNKLRVKYPDLYQQAGDNLSLPSLGSRVRAMKGVEEGSEAPPSPGAPFSPSPIRKSSSLSQLPKTSTTPLRKTGSQTQLNVDKLREEGLGQKQLQRRAQDVKINHAILMLFAVHALPISLLDSGFWKHLMKVLDPGFTPVSAETFKTVHLGPEARDVRAHTKERLQQSSNLTLTFDGTSIRKPTAVYTTHATTPERKTYFLSGHFDAPGDSQSHNADWVTEKLAIDILNIGVQYWGGMSSDNTGVTKNSRRDTNSRWPTIEDLRDCIHLIQNTLENITKLPEFKEFGSLLKEILKHFKKSTHSTLRLLEEQLEQAGGKGSVKTLKSIGKTRFGTWYIAVQSLLPHLMTIRMLYQKKDIKFKSKRLQELFSPNGTHKFLDFEESMKVYMRITEPFVRALWSLEAASANASDVLVFWVAIGGTLKARFENPECNIPTELANKVVDIFNKRYDEMFENDLYFLALMLDPRFNREDILLPNEDVPVTITLRRPQASSSNTMAPSTAPPATDPDMPFTEAFTRVKERLKSMLKAMLNFAALHPNEGHPLLKSLGEGGAATRLRDQLTAFWRGAGIWQANKSLPNTDPYKRWTLVGAHPDADILSLLAKKVFAILVNSMPDERTNSTITWMNSAIRSSQSPETILNTLTVRQWYLLHDVPPEVFELMSEAQKRMSQAGSKPTYRPVVKFRALPSEILRQTQGLRDLKEKGTAAAAELVPESILVSESTVPAEEAVSSDEEDAGEGHEDGEGDENSTVDDATAFIKVTLKKIRVHKEINFESDALLDMLSDVDVTDGRRRQPKDTAAPSRPAGGDSWNW